MQGIVGRIIAFFNKPYGLLTTFSNRLLFASGMFIFSIIFIFLFVPFNISEWIVYTSPFKKLQLPGLALITGSTIYFSQFIQYFLFKNKAMKVYHLLIGFLIDIVVISIPFSILYAIPANSFLVEFK